MELRDYIESGIAKFGTGTELAKALGMNANQVRDAKGHRCGLPVWACIKLSSMIGADPLEVIAASELVTEKREDRKAIFLPFVQMGRMAHPMIAIITTTATALVLAMENSGSIIRSFGG